jgi:hypothetical protein
MYIFALATILTEICRYFPPFPPSTCLVSNLNKAQMTFFLHHSIEFLLKLIRDYIFAGIDAVFN